jgi:FkbM family methyltransferase
MSALTDWYKDDGDNALTVNYPLTEDSVVFDVGGYQGDWSARIAKKYNLFIHIFEPVKSFYEIAKNRFENNPKIGVFNFGLGARDEEVKISLEGYGSHVCSLSDNFETVLMCDVAQIITHSVDLISINIEGGEYDLLSRMLKTGVVEQCRNIQVQFHNTYPDCEKRRQDIRKELSKTHQEIYNYPFVWESWRRNDR